MKYLAAAIAAFAVSSVAAVPAVATGGPSGPPGQEHPPGQRDNDHRQRDRDRDQRERERQRDRDRRERERNRDRRPACERLPNLCRPGGTLLVEDEPEGANCPTGGVKLTVIRGVLDRNRNGRPRDDDDRWPRDDVDGNGRDDDGDRSDRGENVYRDPFDRTRPFPRPFPRNPRNDPDDQVFYICNGATGPAGPTGPQGPVGPQGPQGPAGPPATLTGLTPDQLAQLIAAFGAAILDRPGVTVDNPNTNTITVNAGGSGASNRRCSKASRVFLTRRFRRFAFVRVAIDHENGGSLRRVRTSSGGRYIPVRVSGRCGSKHTVYIVRRGVQAQLRFRYI